MSRLHAAVAGTPVPWKRPASGERKHTHRHDKYLAWREQIGWIVDAERKRQRLPQPMAMFHEDVSLSLAFIGAPTKADTDNLAKAVLDALANIVYADDCHGAEVVHIRLRMDDAEALLDVVDAAPRNLACERLPEKVALPPDVEVCGECEKCRFNAALARLDGTEDAA